ncbi:DUF3173 domain-containing protein [Lactiplantibacillus argentoratensis]|uniref:DUF3173 domain-containing protein n=1 Tax=Lactiplantibacillus argentoratensis TaxID=271881 RepID=UPI0021AA3B9D|nr:DUF3173 domain-containing protein [Lactiplantibacillus argentoratensis]MCT4444457.1 DUF3173 domain-containing protein [Lactiplantibacillus argentoratensis]
MTKKFLNYKDLMKCGFKEHTARSIIRQAKKIMVKQGHPLYLNRNLGQVPQKTVESILGTSLDGDVDK